MVLILPLETIIAKLPNYKENHNIQWRLISRGTNHFEPLLFILENF